MDKLVIEGGVALHGETRISGAKNAALPIMCAALLSREPLMLTNVPRLNDVGTMLKLLQQMGGASVMGPMLVGLEKSVQIAPLGAKMSEIYNAAVIAAYDINR